MPELPEVETVVRGLQYLVGQKLDLLEIFDARVWFEAESGPSSFHGLRLLEVGRRGKYLSFRFAGGRSLIGHLRMTGKFLAESSPVIAPDLRPLIGQKRGRGLQIRSRFRFERDSLLFIDTRRFGTLTAVTSEEDYFTRKKIAPDPINSPRAAREHFLRAMEKSGKPVKALLLDQSAVAGVGNIYADEALFATRVHPRTAARRVKDAGAIWDAILTLLRRAIKLGGTTVYDYLDAEGKRGEFGSQLLVYGREEDACVECGTAIKRITLAGRSTHFCPKCQT